MSLLSKLMDTMRLNSDEDEEYFGPEDEYEADRPAKRSPFSSRDDGEGYDEGAEDSKPRFTVIKGSSHEKNGGIPD